MSSLENSSALLTGCGIRILVQGRKPSVIATDLGLPENLVVNQAVRALLLPPLRAPTPAAAAPVVALDPSQLEAASWNGGPLLVDAGPGTGKTRTLVHRIGLLLEKSLPASILALTFSVKAAEEMRERLSVMNAQAAIEMWIGNFHGFGWELLGKHHELINRTINVRLLDETASLGLLEDNLERLPLQHFLNIYEPAFDLTYVLRAISRCKDEMITPEEYLAEAEVAARSTDPAVREAADKALELAAIYKVYQELLQENDVVDFGDLVMLSARLLEDHPEIAEIYHARFKHILVDEYQDVNLASARLLRALCKPDTDVWVVPDPPSQSIVSAAQNRLTCSDSKAILQASGARFSTITAPESLWCGSSQASPMPWKVFGLAVRGVPTAGTLAASAWS